MKIYNNILKAIEEKGAAYFILIDPDKISENNLSRFLSLAEEAGVDGFLLGGSLLLSGDLKSVIKRIKEESQIPIIIFPGSVSQVLPEADALLYISLISGRNADHIIGNHVLAAPMIKKSGIEPISTGYILVESGKVTTAEYMSGSKPIPRNKPEIAVATALAAEFMGMKMVYLEGGSGAELTVPNEMVKYVSSQCSIPGFALQLSMTWMLNRNKSAVIPENSAKNLSYVFGAAILSFYARVQPSKHGGLSPSR